MNEDILKGKWNQLVGDAKSKWGKLTEDDLKEVEGDRQKLAGKLQETYGYTRQEAERSVDEFMREKA